jgi:hypothetical protein
MLFFSDQDEYDKYMSRCMECEQADSVFCDECEDKRDEE